MNLSLEIARSLKEMKIFFFQKIKDFQCINTELPRLVRPRTIKLMSFWGGVLSERAQ